MTKKATSIWAYIGWVGFIIAMCQSCKDECKFHLNQSLVSNIFFSGLGVLTGMLGWIPWLGWILDLLVFTPCWIALFVFWLLAFIPACRGEEMEMPLIGKIRIIK